MSYRKFLLLAGIAVLTTLSSSGQSVLSRNITVNISRARLDDVLEVISNKGNFYFSYNSSIVKKDSIISLNVTNKPVKEILKGLFDASYEFRESGEYIIIRKAPIHITMVTKKAVAEDKIYSVSGFVYDEMSGAAIYEASIYEKRLLASALTNDNGYFKIKLKSSKASAVELTVSKEFYEDTTIKIESRHNQEITVTMMPVELEYTVTITPQDYLLPDSLKPDIVVDISRPILSVDRDSAKVERTKVGRFLFSTKQAVQSLNLKNFFTTRPFQVSLIPNVGSHGKLSSQVVNNFSLNIFGGYTAGTNGFEVGGLFNINKRNVQYVQTAGIFNVVGGYVKGVQTAGISNTVLDSVKGVQTAGINNIVRGKFTGLQTAGINNIVKGKFTGLQTAGIYNHVADSVKGLQVAGIGNFARKKVSGMQVAGIVNFSNREMDGVQVAGIINYARKLRGFQFGLINISDTSEGFSIGLINIVFKGYHKLSISANEVTHVNAAFKTGNSKLYSILQAGATQNKNNKVYSFGYGLGSEFNLNKSKTLTLNPELSSQYLYLGSWDYTNILNKLHLNLNVKLNKYISFFVGPSYAIYVSDQDNPVAGYRFAVAYKGFATNSFSDRVTGWFGWNAGINLF